MHFYPKLGVRGDFSTLGKLTNIWRQHAKLVISTWSYINAVEAATHALKLPPRALSGRLGSVSDLVARYNTMPAGSYRAVFDVITGQGKKSQPSHAALGYVQRNQKPPICDADAENNAVANLQEPDELRIEQIRAHCQRFSRWKREVRAPLCDPIWRQVLYVFEWATTTDTHLMNWINTQRSDDVSPGTVEDIVCHRLCKFQYAYENCARDGPDMVALLSANCNGCGVGDILVDACDNDIYHLLCFARVLIYTGVSNLNRRVSEKCNTDPWRLLNMLTKEKCAQTAATLLKERTASLEPNSLKLRILFRK